MPFFRFALVSLLCCLPSLASAAEYLEPKSGISFSYEDSWDIQPFALAPDSDEVAHFRLLNPSSSAQGLLFDISVTSRSLPQVLLDLQLKTINTQEKSNLELLERTAIRLDGSGFENETAMTVIVVPLEDQTLVVQSFGQSEAELLSFLNRIAKPGAFLDVRDDELRDEIEKSYEKGIFAGYELPNSSFREFRPRTLIDRASFMKVLVLSTPGFSQELVDQKWKSSPPRAVFTDVPGESWYAPYVSVAKTEGWIQGYPDESFRPEQPINLAEATKILLNSRGIEVAPDTEVWFRPFLAALVDRNILVQGGDQYRFSFGSEAFHSYDPVTRSRVAALLIRLEGSQEGLANVFGKSLQPEQLPFRLSGSEAFTALELGASSRASGVQNRYLLQLGSGSRTEVLEYDADVWTQKERAGELSGMKYLAETSTQVYALRSDKDAPDLSTRFLISNQDLQLSDDANLRFGFMTLPGSTASTDTTGGIQQVQVFDPYGVELMMVSVFPKRGKEALRYAGKDPLQTFQIGSRPWYLYQEQLGSQVRVTLATDLNGSLAVASFRSDDAFAQLSHSQTLLLRTLHLQ